jgi:hypothetical protein
LTEAAARTQTRAARSHICAATPQYGIVTYFTEAIVTAPIIDAPGLLSQANQVSPKRMPLFLSDGQDGPDLLDTADAIQPIAELCAHRDTQTPFMVALVGPSGAGKSFA